MSKNKSTIDLTSGRISLGLVKFALPLMAGNVLQQCYNLTDTLVVGRFIGKNALATVISQYFAGLCLTIYAWRHFPQLRFKKAAMVYDQAISKSILSLAGLTALQQSIMNLGILMVQGRINSFGVNVMAAFSSAVKIDTLAYSPVQDFGNAYSTFVAQNYDAQQADGSSKETGRPAGGFWPSAWLSAVWSSFGPSLCWPSLAVTRK